MMRNASKTIMAVDASKFLPQDRRPALRQPDLRAGDYLITDHQISSAFNDVIGSLTVIVAA